MYQLLWRHLFREPALLKRYVLPVAPERHGGFSYRICYGASRETTLNFLNSHSPRALSDYAALCREL
jgi:hypothetical protein